MCALGVFCLLCGEYEVGATETCSGCGVLYGVDVANDDGDWAAFDDDVAALAEAQGDQRRVIEERERAVVARGRRAS